MRLTKKQIADLLTQWNEAWNGHDIDKVAELFHDDIIFEHWTGATVKGAGALKKAWEPWFKNHGGFHFHTEDLFIDEEAQKVLFQWTLSWPSTEKKYKGKSERRRGVDVMHFENGKIVGKFTYSKTTVEIEGKQVKSVAE